MRIKAGGQTASLIEKDSIESITAYHESYRTVNLIINGSSITYLTIDEALNLRDELESAVKKALFG